MSCDCNHLTLRSFPHDALPIFPAYCDQTIAVAYDVFYPRKHPSGFPSMSHRFPRAPFSFSLGLWLRFTFGEARWMQCLLQWSGFWKRGASGEVTQRPLCVGRAAIACATTVRVAPSISEL